MIQNTFQFLITRSLNPPRYGSRTVGKRGFTSVPFTEGKINENSRSNTNIKRSSAISVLLNPVEVTESASYWSVA